MKEAHDGDSNDVLVADLCVRGVWLPQAEALFDIRIIDTDAHCHPVIFESAPDVSDPYC